MASDLLVVNENAAPGAKEEALDYSRIFEIPRIPPEVIAEWIGRARNGSLASAHTRRNYQADIEDFEVWRDGRQIVPDLVEGYLEYRRETAEHDLSPTYRRRILAALRWWVRSIKAQVQARTISQKLWPWKSELLNQLDLAAWVMGPRGQRKEAARAGRHITDEEAMALLDICLDDPNEQRGARDLAMIAVAISAGPRVHEITGITLADIVEETDAEGLAYRINVIGKGDKEGELLVVGVAAEYLKRWLAVRGNLSGGLFCPISHWGNPRREKHRETLKPMTTEAARLILAERCAQAGITRRTTWHDFRRTLIGNLIRHDIGIAQRTARHASVTQTAKYDRRPDEETRSALRSEMRRLQQAIESDP